jgi:hypothetical protein
MKRSERFSKAEADPQQHGLNGPMKVTSISASDPKRKSPLREVLQNAWAKLGIERVPPSVGKLTGLSEFLENWDAGIRQASHLSYGLAGIDIRTQLSTD